MTTRHSQISFARALVATSVKAAATSRGAFAIQVLFMVVNNLTFFIFWWALMHRVPQVRGWDLGDIEVLFGIVAGGYGLAVTMAGGVRHLGRLIEDGELDTLLAQPRPVLLYALGLRSQASGVGDVISAVAFLAVSGHVTWTRAPLALIAIVASATMFVACGVIFYSLSFWLGRVETLARQLWELLLTFATYPEPLFGGVLRLLLFTVLPAGFVGYVPARLVQDPSLAQAALMVGVAGAYLVVAAVVFNRGLARYTSGSGFRVFG